MTKSELKALENSFKTMWRDAVQQQIVVEDNVDCIGRQMLTAKGNKDLFTKFMLEANGARLLAADILEAAYGGDDAYPKAVDTVNRWIMDVEEEEGRALNQGYDIEYK